MSVLLLFSDTGGGHRAAARALAGAFRRLAPGARVAAIDPLLGQGPPAVRRICSLYPVIIQRWPSVWGVIYHASNAAPAFGFLQAAFGARVRQALAGQLDALDPDLLVSVHPLLNHVTGPLLDRGRRRGLVTVVTDLIEVHRGWSFSGADLVVVPTEEARAASLRAGVCPDRIRRLGFPVDLGFRPPAPGETAAIRRRIGLEAGRPTILVIGGGEGSGRLLDQVRVLACRPHDWQVVAVCGRNRPLRRRLEELPAAAPLRVLGFVEDMPDLLRAADLVVTKAGPGAIAEALATGVPLVLTGYLPGQETANVRLVTGSGAGIYVPRPELLPGAIRELLADPDRHRRMRARATALSRPAAALDIARSCLTLAAAYRAASQARR
ncbi:MAG TPA: glycosyltransferase [Candidatus Dormibacteraeota bacterium]|nr:glycosyltransferase [Candidatus Dormibacteraeota bacterium]